MMQDMNNATASYIRLGIVIFILLLAAIIVPNVLVGPSTVKLASSPSLVGEVTQALTLNSQNSAVPVYNTDFKLENTRYFDSATWAVAKVVSPNNSTNTSFVVLQKQDGFFQVVLGPGSAFSSAYQQSMPRDVATYLFSQGLFYESVN